MSGIFRLTITALLAAMMALPASAQRARSDWVLLGEQEVGFRVDRDVIRISREGVRFSQLRIEAERNEVYLISVGLVYQNGFREEFRVDNNVKPGNAPVINLRGDRSYLKQIELVYRARPDFRGRAIVRVYGELAGSGRDDRVAERDRRGFAEIESQRISRRDRSPVVFDVGRRDGRFASLRFQAKDGEIRIEDVRITFGNGQTQSVSVGDRIGEDEFSRPIDLEGDRRFIRSVRVEARPARGNRDARLVLLGRADESREPVRRPRPDLGRFSKVDTQRVTRRDDDGVIEFDVGRDEGRIAELRFLAEDGDFVIREATILFGNGETQRARVGERLEENELSDVIDLAGEQRFVRKVRISGRLTRGERAGNLVLLAREDAGRRGYRPPGREADRGGGREEWVVLGRNSASMLSSDNDSFEVGRDMGTFRAIRVAVAKQDVRFYGMTIVYGNGEQEQVPLDGTIRKGEVSQPYDLKGRDRFIQRIIFRYRSKLSLKGSGKVEIQGLKHGPYRGR